LIFLIQQFILPLSGKISFCFRVHGHVEMFSICELTEDNVMLIAWHNLFISSNIPNWHPRKSHLWPKTVQKTWHTINPEI